MGGDDGPVARCLAGLSAQSLRVVGLTVTALSAAVIWVSVTTDYGLSAGEGAATTATIGLSGGSATANALVTFALGHPAYPAAFVLGVVLFALGDEVPLLGN